MTWQRRWRRRTTCWARAAGPGSIVVLADAVPADQRKALEARRHRGGGPVHFLAAAAGPETPVPADSPPAPALDRASMQAAADATGGTLTLVSADDHDVRRLA